MLEPQSVSENDNDIEVKNELHLGFRAVAVPSEESYLQGSNHCGACYNQNKSRKQRCIKQA